MRHNRMRGVVGATVAAVTLLAPTTPADASVTGALVFVCRASIPVFPSSLRPGGTCAAEGQVPGTALGVGVVTVGTDVYVLAGTGTFSATFSYDETCPPLPPLPIIPLLGTANGSATVTGVAARRVSDPLTPRVATVTTDFTWARVGLTAVIVTRNTRVAIAGGPTAVSASPLSGTVDDVAVAAFVPIPPQAGGPGLGNCAAPAPTDAAVVGADVVPV